MTKPIHSITVSRLIGAPRTRVFDAFARSEALTEWFTPSPEITVEVVDFRFAPGGGFRLRYTMPDGSQPVVGGSYELIEAPRQIAFSWVWEAPDPHAGISTRVLVEFIEKDEATEVVLTHDRLPTLEAATRHAEGWKGTLDVLASALAAPEVQTSTLVGGN